MMQMQIRPKIVLSLLIFLFFPEKTLSSIEREDIFFKKTEQLVTSYSILEPVSKCKLSVLVYDENFAGLNFGIVYGLNKDCEKPYQTRKIYMSDFAVMFQKIINNFNLQDTLKDFEGVEVSVHWALKGESRTIVHGPLIKSINDNSFWPIDIEEDLLEKVDREVAYKKYVSFLKNEITKSYAPLLDIFKSWGVTNARVGDLVMDPVYFDSRYSRSNSKIFLKKELKFDKLLDKELTKDIYPFSKSPIFFILKK